MFRTTFEYRLRIQLSQSTCHNVPKILPRRCATKDSDLIPLPRHDHDRLGGLIRRSHVLSTPIRVEILLSIYSSAAWTYKNT